MFPKKLLTGSIIVCSLVAIMYLIIQLNSAYGEFIHWKTRETFLEEKLVELQTEASSHRQFLNRLRTDPAFQDAVARKELGYGKKDELLYRFPEEKNIGSQ
jgi:cell division protein FtsB